MKVLIATDGSEYGDAAIAAAKDNLASAGREFRVITVLEHPPVAYITGGEALPMAYGGWAPEARAELAKIAAAGAQRLIDAGFAATSVVREGHAADEIIAEAKTWRADLIIVGTHGRHGLSRFLLGSVAERVARHAPCSVEIVRLGKQAA